MSVSTVLLDAAIVYAIASVSCSLLVGVIALRRVTCSRLHAVFVTARRRKVARARSGRNAGAALALAALCGSALAISGDARAEPSPGAPDAAAGENAALYCRNIADAAADARFTRQQAALAAMEKEIEARLAQLEAKRAEYQEWLARRETFLKKADDSLIAVVSQMRPDAAAAQLAAMNEDMAAAVLARLSPRVASAILNESEPARAARLTSTMVGMARRAQEGRTEAPRTTGRPG
ncbi:MotE family protein [Xanthobacter flavus]|uniref:MotE family protein n=1 Tax=Xanthobacter flavus TaxID=281 RepID=UPI001AE74158|nr:MotE family protein [Xanthobacter flavus]MBP2149125.1 flagellar motility protein MotE (MotC chaperone) [Xanthobacter flavus]